VRFVVVVAHPTSCSHNALELGSPLSRHDLVVQAGIKEHRCGVIRLEPGHAHERLHSLAELCFEGRADLIESKVPPPKKAFQFQGGEDLPPSGDGHVRVVLPVEFATVSVNCEYQRIGSHLWFEWMLLSLVSRHLLPHGLLLHGVFLLGGLPPNGRPRLCLDVRQTRAAPI
jgi:hypothetical protein